MLEAKRARNQWFQALCQNGVLFGRPLGTTSEEMLAEVSLETNQKNCLKPLALST